MSISAPWLLHPDHPSPAAWEDQVFYFLLVDRFSDGQEDGHLDLAGNRSPEPLHC